MKKRDIQKERWFILGVIEAEDKRGKLAIEAALIYNPISEEHQIVSMNTIINMIDANKEIIGARIRETRRYIASKEEYIINREALIKNQYYKTKDLPKLNGQGEIIITPGKGVVVGCIEKHGKVKFVVMTASLKKQYLSKEEVINGGYIGVYRNQIMRASQLRIDLLKEKEK